MAAIDGRGARLRAVLPDRSGARRAGRALVAADPARHARRHDAVQRPARGLPGLSRSLLTKRLRQFERAGLVERLDSEYLLTDAGRELEPIVFGLGAWGAQWTFGEPDPDELDPELLVWWMHTRLDTSGLPGRRHVLHIRFTDDPQAVLDRDRERHAVGVPRRPRLRSRRHDHVRRSRSLLPGVARPDAAPGRDRAPGSVEFDGPRALTRRMPEVLQLSPVADIVGSAG